MLLYAMINRLKIGFEFADLSDHSFEGHVKWFKLAEDGRIAVLLGSPGEKPRVLDIAFAKYAKTKVS